MKASYDDKNRWQEEEALASLARCTPAEACKGGFEGEANCHDGYQGARCSACAQLYYRSNNLCKPCGTPIPLWVWAALALLVFVAFSLAADKFLSGVKDGTLTCMCMRCAAP